MFKPSVNPKVEELTKSCVDRRINLSDLDAIMIEGKRHCCWCSTPLKGRQYKWCSSECAGFAWAWANPQSDEGLKYLLIRQDWKCKSCQYDYKLTMISLVSADRFVSKKNGITDDLLASLPSYYMRRMKYRLPKQYKPEVDHIVPIYKGGQSLGLDNHQAICYSCHKTKTKSDLSGKRKKNV